MLLLVLVVVVVVLLLLLLSLLNLVVVVVSRGPCAAGAFGWLEPRFHVIIIHGRASNNYFGWLELTFHVIIIHGIIIHVARASGENNSCNNNINDMYNNIIPRTSRISD